MISRASGSREKSSLFKLTAYSLSFLAQEDKFKLRILTLAQFIVGFMDAIGLIALGILVSIGLSYTQGGSASIGLNSFLSLFNLSELSIEFQMLFFGTCAVFFLTSRTLISLYLYKKTFIFLGRVSAKVSKDLLMRNFKNNFAWLRHQGTDDLAFSLTEGTNFLVTGVLSSSMALVTEIGLLTLILMLLAIVNFQMAFFALAFFSIVGLIIYLKIHVRISAISKLKSKSVADGNKQIAEMYKLYREIHVTRTWEYFEDRFFKSRLVASRLFGLQSWLLQIPRMSVEIAIVVGGASLAIVSIAGSNFKEALPDIVMFIAATSRLAPSVLRIQQSAVSIRGFAGSASDSLNYTLKPEKSTEQYISDSHNGATITEESDLILALKNTAFKFDDSDESIINTTNFEFRSGEIIALVGASGAGKSTLCDLILGVQNPTEGEISINGIPISVYIDLKPGSVAYLPQDVYLLDESIIENVAFGVNPSDVDLDRVRTALIDSGLTEFVKLLLDSDLTQDRKKLQISGGQRQRIGLARALYANPVILILDEPTSALDSETEKIVMSNLQLNKNNRITIIVAHREATINLADKIVSLKNGVLKSL